eukprot:3749798-Pleurochrysis_carterae.AAC.1
MSSATAADGDCQVSRPSGQLQLHHRPGTSDQGLGRGYVAPVYACTPVEARSTQAHMGVGTPGRWHSRRSPSCSRGARAHA